MSSRIKPKMDLLSILNCLKGVRGELFGITQQDPLERLRREPGGPSHQRVMQTQVLIQVLWRVTVLPYFACFCQPQRYPSSGFRAVPHLSPVLD